MKPLPAINEENFQVKWSYYFRKIRFYKCFLHYIWVRDSIFKNFLHCVKVDLNNQPRNFSFVVKMFAQIQVDTLLDGNDVDECQRKCISRHTTSFLNSQ